jgi:flagellar biosynthesis protein FliR
MGVEFGTVAPVAARIFGALVGLPISDGLQLLPRLFLAICFALPLAQSLPVTPVQSVSALVVDFLIGFIVVVPSRVMAEAGGMFGEVVDTARGQTIGSILDPLQGQQGSDLATIVRLGVIVMVVWLAGIEAALGLVCETFTIKVPASILLNAEGLLSVIRMGCLLAGASLQLASMWLLGFLIIDLGCGLLAKVAVGLSFSSSAQLLKLVITFVLLLNLLRDSGATQARLGRVLKQPLLLDGARQDEGVRDVR